MSNCISLSGLPQRNDFCFAQCFVCFSWQWNKIANKSSLRGKGLLLLTVLRLRGIQSTELEVVGLIVLEVRKENSDYLCLAWVFLFVCFISSCCSPGFNLRKWYNPFCVGLPTSVNLIKRIPTSTLKDPSPRWLWISSRWQLTLIIKPSFEH